MGFNSAFKGLKNCPFISLVLTIGCTQCRFLHRSFLTVSRRAHTRTVSLKSILYWKKKCCLYKQLFSCSARTFTATFLSPQLISCQCVPSLIHSTSVCSLSDMRSAYSCRTVYSTDRRPNDIYGMTHRWGRRRVHIGRYNITEDLGR